MSRILDNIHQSQTKEDTGKPSIGSRRPFIGWSQHCCP